MVAGVVLIRWYYNSPYHNNGAYILAYSSLTLMISLLQRVVHVQALTIYTVALLLKLFSLIDLPVISPLRYNSSCIVLNLERD